MKQIKSLIVMIVAIATVTTVYGQSLTPEEVEKLLKEQEMGKTYLSPDLLPAVEQTAKEVFLNRSQEWDKKSLINLLRVSAGCKIPSLTEVSSVARYHSIPKVSQEASAIFEELQLADWEKSESQQARRDIERRLLAVNTAPWPVSKDLWDNYRYWVTPADVKALFNAASMNQIYSSYMFDLATYVAIKIYTEEGCSTQYQEVLILIEQAHIYEPKLADKAIKRIQNNIKN